MAVQSSLYSNTVTVGVTEVSATAGGTTIQSRTEAGAMALVVDVSALAAGDEYEFAVHEKAIFGGTQRREVLANLVGAQASPIWISEHRQLGVGWDFGLKKIAGTDRSLSWSVRAITAVSVFEPATLANELWVRGSYAGSPWAGNGSAGGSGARTLTEATIPATVGALVNGYAPAEFSGSSNRLTGIALSNYMTSGGYSGCCWVYVDAVNTDTVPNSNDTLLSSAGTGSWCIYLRSTGKVGHRCLNGAGSVDQTVEANIAFAQWNFVQWRHDGNNIYIRVNGGAWVSAACVGIFSLAANLDVGKSVNGDNWFDGKIMEIMLSKSVWDDTTFNSLKTYGNTRYGFTL